MHRFIFLSTLTAALITGCATVREYGTVELVSSDERGVVRSIAISRNHHTLATISFRADGTLESQTVYPPKPEQGQVVVVGCSTEYDSWGNVKEQHDVASPWIEDGTP